MRLIRTLFLLGLATLLFLLSLANSEKVTLYFLPKNLTALFEIEIAVKIPLFLVKDSRKNLSEACTKFYKSWNLNPHAVAVSNIKIFFFGCKKKNKVLIDYCYLLKKNKRLILNHNKMDINIAQKKRLKANLIDRLILDDKKISKVINSIKTIIKLKDPKLIKFNYLLSKELKLSHNKLTLRDWVWIWLFLQSISSSVEIFSFDLQ